MSQLTPAGRTWATGLTVFAAVMMMIGGFVQALQGIVALANDTFYVVGHKYTFQFNVTTWGWIHLLVGAGVVVVGIFLMRGSAWARWTGIALVAVSAIANFAWIPYYPVWGIIVMALDGAVIWALSVDPTA
jgi:hypothetical protein